MMTTALRSTMGLGMVQKVNRERVIKEGQLCKRGDTLKLYKKLYNFYLEHKDPFGSGPLLKYGRVGFPLSTCLDLGFTSAQILKNPKKDRFFAIATSTITLRLRAATKLERDSWCDALTSSLVVNDHEPIVVESSPRENAIETSAAEGKIQALISVIEEHKEGVERVIVESTQEMEEFQGTLPLFLSQEFEKLKQSQISKIREIQKGLISVIDKASNKQEVNCPMIIEEIQEENNSEEIKTIFHDAFDK